MNPRRRRLGWLLPGLMIALSACDRRDAEPAAARAVPVAEALALARQVADTMTADLRARVFAELERAGPAAAMAVCADSAQAVTARHARAGVTVRRVSDRFRNPANRPDAFESGWLERLDSLRAAGTLPVEVIDTVVEDGGRALRYLRPVLVAEPCLACHGDRAGMQPAVLGLLDARYPEDRATGYRAGELRGAVSVRVPVQQE